MYLSTDVLDGTESGRKELRRAMESLFNSDAYQRNFDLYGKVRIDVKEFDINPQEGEGQIAFEMIEEPNHADEPITKSVWDGSFSYEEKRGGISLKFTSFEEMENELGVENEAAFSNLYCYHDGAYMDMRKMAQKELSLSCPTGAHKGFSLEDLYRTGGDMSLKEALEVVKEIDKRNGYSTLIVKEQGDNISYDVLWATSGLKNLVRETLRRERQMKSLEQSGFQECSPNLLYSRLSYDGEKKEMCVLKNISPLEAKRLQFDMLEKGRYTAFEQSKENGTCDFYFYKEDGKQLRNCILLSKMEKRAEIIPEPEKNIVTGYGRFGCIKDNQIELPNGKKHTLTHEEREVAYRYGVEAENNKDKALSEARAKAYNISNPEAFQYLLDEVHRNFAGLAPTQAITENNVIDVVNDSNAFHEVFKSIEADISMSYSDFDFNVPVEGSYVAQKVEEERKALNSTLNELDIESVDERTLKSFSLVKRDAIETSMKREEEAKEQKTQTRSKAQSQSIGMTP